VTFLSPFVKDSLYQLYCSFDSDLVLEVIIDMGGVDAKAMDNIFKI